MLTFILFLTFASVILFCWAVLPFDRLDRPRLQSLLQEVPLPSKEKKKSTSFFKSIAFFNKPFALTIIGRRIAKDLNIAKVEISAEEFFLIKKSL